MVYRYSDFYDDKTVFEQYINQRRSVDNLNDVIEKPILVDLIGNVKGKDILDLGCGDGEIGFDFLNHGCLSYTGVDGSKNMIDFANKNFAGVKNAQFEKSLLQEWNFPTRAYDMVVSRMSLHYLSDSDLLNLFNEVYQSLKVGGEFVFSVEHPFATFNNYSQDYYEVGEQVCYWLDNEVIKVHRKIEDYFNLLQQAGFKIAGLRENRRIDELEGEEKKMPLVLLLKSEK
ncbi:class I SAM-dependent methyltransferase [Salirhabdus salicampi]|uniref:class I SAM-dependent methyltransferase n=1 Tax=Salirhabdus salicampi TaxID=476102 RepID=UPI0020C3E5FE|nr:class I SAM-dependent methyltransferase [Salirhabdus salicampi]MCP8616947.1 class I SAM-dependent methyltransferase [Salirhabdus salicampi]